jgi:hypothetical protein
MIPPDPRHALMEQLRALKFPNSHHGAGPHCTCSQDERERSADVLRILLDRLLVASPAPQPDDALAFQRQRADKWVDIATQRSLEIEDLKGEIERLQEGAASPVPQPEFDDHHGPFCDVTCPCGRGNVAASPAPHPNDPDVETRLRESLGALEHPSANEIAVELKVTADKDFGLIYYVRRGDVLHWFVREVKPLLAGAASPAPPACEICKRMGLLPSEAVACFVHSEDYLRGWTDANAEAVIETLKSNFAGDDDVDEACELIRGFVQRVAQLQQAGAASPAPPAPAAQRFLGDCPLGPSHQHSFTLWDGNQCEHCMMTKSEVGAALPSPQEHNE